MNDFDFILNAFFVTLGGEGFVLGLIGLAMAFIIILSLVDSIIDL